MEEDRDYERTIRDGLSAYQYLREVSPRNVTGCFVAGYSFGALIATLAAPQLEGLQGLLLVSPPFGKMDPARIQAPNCPVLILAGKKDFVFDETALNTASECLGDDVTLETLTDADHFFRGEEQLIVRRIINFLDKFDRC